MPNIIIDKLMRSIVQTADRLGKPFILRKKILSTQQQVYLSWIVVESPTGDELFVEDEADFMIRVVGLSSVILYTGHHAPHKSPPDI